MVLAILVIARTLGAITEGQRRVILLCPTADRTFVLGDSRTRSRLGKLGMELLLAFFLLVRHAVLAEKEKQSEI
jgi:hypothetical protein